MNKAYSILVICVLTRSYLSVACLSKNDFDKKYTISGQSSSSDFILKHEPEMRGSFGGVFRVDLLMGSSTQKYIVKRPLLNTAEEIEDFEIELVYIEKMGSSGLGPQFFDCFQENDNRFVVMESLPCTFNTLISNPKQPSGVIPVRKSICEKNFTDLPAGVQFFYIWQMIKVLAQIHDLGYVHHDIKPENLALTANGIEVKYLDFGLMDRTKNTSTAGTLAFMHPLKLLLRAYHKDQNEDELHKAWTKVKRLDQTKADIWSLGITILLLLKPEFKIPIDNKDLSESSMKKAIEKLKADVEEMDLTLLKGDKDFNKLVHSMINFDNSITLPSLKELDEKMDKIYLNNWPEIQESRYKYFCRESPEFTGEEGMVKR